MPRPLGITSLQILSALRSRSSYGLDIVGTTGLPSGTVYPTLARLKRSGLVSSRWEDQRTAEREGRPRRRYYELTGAGEHALARGTARLSGLAAELEASAAGRSASEAWPVRARGARSADGGPGGRVPPRPRRLPC